MDDDLDGLLGQLHGRCFRILVAALGADHQGISTAARHARRQGLVSKEMSEQLVRLDVAFAVGRRLDAIKLVMFAQDLTCMIETAKMGGQVQAKLMQYANSRDEASAETYSDLEGRDLALLGGP